MRQSLSGEEEAPRSIDVASEEDEDDEDDVTSNATIPNRRGRKPGSGKPGFYSLLVIYLSIYLSILLIYKSVSIKKCNKKYNKCVFRYYSVC
jgi:hypothetical protein